MTPLLSILFGLVLGFIGVGLPTLRTLWTSDGHYIRVFFVSVASTICLFIFTNMVVKKNMEFMAANAIGAGLSVSVISYKRRNNANIHSIH